MPASRRSPADAAAAAIVEQMAGFGPVQVRAMFGGHGFHAQGLEGALSGRSWQEFAQTERASLLMALEDARSQTR